MSKAAKSTPHKRKLDGSKADLSRKKEKTPATLLIEFLVAPSSTSAAQAEGRSDEARSPKVEVIESIPIRPFASEAPQRVALEGVSEEMPTAVSEVPLDLTLDPAGATKLN